MAVHHEEAAFVVRLRLSADFDEDYDGDDDGYAWLAAWHAGVRPRIVRAVFEQLRAEPGFNAFATSRGQSPDDEIEIAVRFEPNRTKKG